MLTEQQLVALTVLFRHGADDASSALSKWLGRPARISVEQVEQVTFEQVGAVLASPDSAICACMMTVTGRVTGQLILAFDDASGLALADLLLNQDVGTASDWGEVEQSAALETANIVGCAYLNALAHFFQAGGVASHELVPTPPRFVRDFAASLLQFALMNQAQVSDQLFLTRTEFSIEKSPVNWSLVFVPDAQWFLALREMLPT